MTPAPRRLDANKRPMIVANLSKSMMMLRIALTRPSTVSSELLSKKSERKFRRGLDIYVPLILSWGRVQGFRFSQSPPTKRFRPGALGPGNLVRGMIQCPRREHSYGIAPGILRLSHLWITLVDILQFIRPDGLEGFNEKA